MRQVADQLLVGLRLVSQALLALLPGLLLQRQQLDNRLARRVGLRHHHMHRQRLLAQPPEPGVVAQHGKFITAGAVQRMRQELRLGKALGQLRAFDGAAGHA